MTARRILVTGTAGFIGSNFVRWWRGCHPNDHIVALDRLTYAGGDSIPVMKHAPLVEQHMIEAIGDLRQAADERRFERDGGHGGGLEARASNCEG